MHLVVEELLVQIHISALRADLEKYSSGNHNEFLNVFFPSSSSSFRKNCENLGIKLALFICHDVFMSPANAASLRRNITTSLILVKNRPSFKLLICGLHWLLLKILPLTLLSCIPCCSRSTLPRDWLKHDYFSSFNQSDH